MDLEVLENNKPYFIPSQLKLPETCFRAYDIRGEVSGDGLNPDIAYAVGLAIGSEALSLKETSIFVGMDGRLSGPLLREALISGLRQTGIDVIKIGMVPTPVLYFATSFFNTHSGVMVTGSHNPKNHNGFKIVLNGSTLAQDGISKLKERIEKQNFILAKEMGSLSSQDVFEEYYLAITNHITLKRPLKVVLDSGHGAGSITAIPVYKRLGVELIELYSTVDGHFPSHHPDPSDPNNLVDLIETVKSTQADLGLAFDGDGDRVGVVTNKGEIIWPDRQMMLFSEDALKKYPGSPIVFDIKCSRLLEEKIQALGGQAVMWKTGHSIIKAKLKALKAPLAGEMSGHLFFNDTWFGFDDGVYVGARLLEILSNQSLSASEVFDALPNWPCTPEIKIFVPDHEKMSLMDRIVEEAAFEGETGRITLDGLRVLFQDAWGLVRASNTSPYLTLRFEGKTKETLKQVQNVFKKSLSSIEPKLVFPSSDWDM